MTRVAAYALTGAALLNLAGRIPGGGYLALVALVPVLWVLAGARSWRSGAGVTSLGSLGLMVLAFEGALVSEPWAFPILVVSQALWYGLAGAIFVIARRAIGVGAALALFPFLWLAAEWLPAQRWLWADAANALSRIGYTQVDTVLRDLAVWSGVSLVSLAVVAVNVGVYVLVRRRGWVIGTATILIPLALGALPTLPWTAESDRSVRAIAVQGSVPTRDIVMGRFDALAARDMLDPYRRLTERAAERSPDLVVWPETILPQPIDDNRAQPWIQAALERAPLALVGGISQRDAGTYNSAFFWDGELTEVYRKRSRIPIIESHYAPGSAVPPVRISGISIGLGICLDSLFPSFARDAVRRGAEALVVITNDNFAIGTVTPGLHARASAFRAVETGRPLLFAAQSGPTAYVSHRGEVTARTEVGRTVALEGVLDARTGLTPFVRFGDTVGAFAAILSMFTLGYGLLAPMVLRGSSVRRPTGASG